MELSFFNLDIEPTNRCNAKCYFCPRDQTPHQGLMAPDVFDASLARAVELRSVIAERFGVDLHVNLCGLGEPLLNKHTPSFVEKVRGEGFFCSMSSNGALLTEARSEALLAAGLQAVEINVGENGDDYEEIYGLPWDTTLANVERFAQMAGDECAVRIVLVDHRQDIGHLLRMKAFWTERGIDQFLTFGIMNRGGTLAVDHMQYESFPELAEAEALLGTSAKPQVCGVPFVFPFIGYDGQYYLCCSDWKKEAPLGSVFERSFADVVAPKLAHVVHRDPVCRGCNHDPLNRMVDALRAGDADRERLVADWNAANDGIWRVIEGLGGSLDQVPARPGGRRLIPVQTLSS